MDPNEQGADSSSSKSNRALDLQSGILVLLAKKLAGNTRTRLEFGALRYRPDEVMDAVADNRSACALGWQPQISLEEGLRLTIEAERRQPRP